MRTHGRNPRSQEFLTLEDPELKNDWRPLAKTVRELMQKAKDHQGQFILVKELEITDHGEQGCFGWRRFPQSKVHIKMAVLHDEIKVQSVFLWMVFGVEKFVRPSQRYGEKPELVENKEMQFGASALTLLYLQPENEYSFDGQRNLEIIIGDDAVENYYQNNGEAIEFRGFCEALGRPNQAMKREAEEKAATEKTAVLSRLNSYQALILADLKRAEELGLNKEPVVKEMWEMILPHQDR